MNANVWEQKPQIEWNPDPVGVRDPSVIADCEGSEEGDSSFLEELAHECMRLSSVKLT
jgi:hypothetical protein